MATAFKSTDILLPNKDINMEKWAVVACDQYTSEPEYWNKTSKMVGENKSALNLILPEIYLENNDVEQRISCIQDTMEKYLNDGTFTEYPDAMIYIERVQDNGKIRAGLVGAIDLEQYDYTKGSVSAVRATEATVVERIPPRIKVRRGAGIELPHIMILIDDENKTVIEPLEAIKNELRSVYSFDLMQKGGSIRGWLVDKLTQKKIVSALENLGDNDTFNAKYKLDGVAPLVYAMGDGNHSLATAKEFYEELKRNNPDKDLSQHPARYALVEIVNLHSPALEFEAIHRIVTEIDTQKLFNAVSDKLGLAEDGNDDMQSFISVIDGKKKQWFVTNPQSKLTVGSLQSVLDEYIKQNGGKIDYIHGEEVVVNLSEADGSIGFILPDMKKSELFSTVICDGALPRKTFSMGHAWDKRYYVEARQIRE